MYLHCKGGHGRSSLVVATLLLYLNEECESPHFLFQKTKLYHQNRSNLKSKYIDIDCPQNLNQRKFIIDMFEKKKASTLN